MRNYAIFKTGNDTINECRSTGQQGYYVENATRVVGRNIPLALLYDRRGRGLFLSRKACAMIPVICVRTVTIVVTRYVAARS